MRKEISYSMTFDIKSDAFTAWDIGASQWTASSGLPEDSAPVLTANMDGTYTAAGTLRRPTDADVEGIAASLSALVGNVAVGSAGFISHHDCYHDEGGPCMEPVTTSWGGEEIANV